VVVGSSDVGRFLAQMAPDRVREHVRWLDEARPQAPGAGGDEPSAAQAATGPVLVRRRRTSSVVMVSALLGALLTATGLLISRSAADRSVSARSEPVASVSTRSERAEPTRVTAVVTPSLSPAPVGDPPTDVARDAPKRAAGSTWQRPRPKLPDGVGTLYVSASPTWATIRLDGKPAGTTPTVFSGLSSGSHVIEALPLGTGPSVRKRVTVEPGGTARVGFEFIDP
jgi:hypothetical protein